MQVSPVKLEGHSLPRYSVPLGHATGLYGYILHDTVHKLLLIINRLELQSISVLYLLKRMSKGVRLDRTKPQN